MDTSSIFSVDGMVAAITGGHSGIGLMMARALAGAGAKKVYLLGRRKDVLDTAAAEHASFVAVQCDVSSKESLQSAVDFITKDAGFVNLLIANSGIGGPHQRFNTKVSIQELRKTMFEDFTMDEFTQTFHINVTGAYFTMLAFLELLDAGNQNAVKGGFGKPLKQGSDAPSIQSQVIFTSSIAGYSRNAISPPAYGGSKSAIAHLAKHAATSLAAFSIRVNALAPGLFPSDMANTLIGDRDPSKESPDHPAFLPCRRFGGEEEMGGTVLYLASRAGAFCNGLILVNDGGRLSVMPSEY